MNDKMNLIEHILLWNDASIKIIDVRHTIMRLDEELRSYRFPASGFMYVTRGSAQVLLDGIEYATKRFHVLHGGKGVCLDIFLTEEVFEYYLILYKATIPRQCRQETLRLMEQNNPFQLQYGFAPLYPASLFDKTDKMIQEWRNSSTLEKFHVKTLFYQFVYDLLRQLQEQGINTVKPDLAEQVIRYIHEHYAEPITLDLLAQLLNYSAKNLSKVFKKQTGFSPIDYLIQVRIDTAIELLLYTDLTIQDIAESVGYSDRLYFTRIFKKQSGFSPGRFKEMAQESKRGADLPDGSNRSPNVPRSPQSYSENNNLYQNKLTGVLDMYRTSTTSAGNGKQNNPSSMVSTRLAEKIITLSWPRDIGPMNPHVYNPSQLIAQSLIYEPLISYKDGGKLEPHLAESWNISQNGKEYTFKLRKNVKLSDGTPFNATVVKKNFDAIMKNFNKHRWLGVIDVLDKTEAMDEYTFKMTLKQPYYPALQDLSVVRPVRFLGEAGFPDDGDTAKGVKLPIGTGPWMLTNYKQDEYAEFSRNPNYWGKRPKADKIVIKIISDGETSVLAFKKKELDLIYGEGIISMNAFKQLKALGKYKTSLSEPIATRLLVLNTTKEALSDLRVRQALQHGFNKQAMVEGITSGLEEKADNILSKNFPYTNHSVTPIDYNVEKAKAYLVEAGWKLPAGKTVREKKGKQFELELIYDQSNEIQKPMAENLQAEWAAIGVKLKISGIELSEQIKRFRVNDFDLNFSLTYGTPYDPHAFIHVVAEKGFGFSDALSNLPIKKEIDQEIHDALRTTDVEKRHVLYESILKKLQDQSALIPLSYIKKTAVYQKGVANPQDNPFNGIAIDK